MSSNVTSKFRKTKNMTEKIYKNVDIVILVLVIALSFIIGFFSCIVLYNLASYLGVIKADPNLYSLVVSVILFISGIISEYYAVIFKLHTPNGEISKELITKANKPKEQLDDNFNTYIGEIRVENVNIDTNKNIIHKKEDFIDTVEIEEIKE